MQRKWKWWKGSPAYLKNVGNCAWPHISRKLDSDREIRGHDKFSRRRREFRCFRFTFETSATCEFHTLLFPLTKISSYYRKKFSRTYFSQTLDTYYGKYINNVWYIFHLTANNFILKNVSNLFLEIYRARSYYNYSK